MMAALCPRDAVQTLPDPPGNEAWTLGEGDVVAGRYRIEGLLGRGAFGRVYVCAQIAMGRRVALKVMEPDLVRDLGEWRRLWGEAKSASRLRHPNVVVMHHFDIDEALRLPFIAMELVEGRTLRRRLDEEGPLSLESAAHIASQVARALDHAWRHEIIHRDLKPANIMVTPLGDDEEHVTVLDFGIAEMVRDGNDDSLTGQPFVRGTPNYMSPEQVRGERLDQRSDLYALGVVFHEMLAGRTPFVADDALGVMLKHLNAMRPPLPRTDGDASAVEAARVLHRALLVSDRDRRPSSVLQVARLFAAIARGRVPFDPARYLASRSPTPVDHSRPSETSKSGEPPPESAAP
jgi:serine/threonine protein kinase